MMNQKIQIHNNKYKYTLFIFINDIIDFKYDCKK